MGYKIQADHFGRDRRTLASTGEIQTQKGSTAQAHTSAYLLQVSDQGSPEVQMQKSEACTLRAAEDPPRRRRHVNIAGSSHKGNSSMYLWVIW